MTSRIEKDGKYYRMRRGRLVEIPEEWVGEVTHSQTKRKRPSHFIHKQRKAAKLGRGFPLKDKMKRKKDEGC